MGKKNDKLNGGREGVEFKIKLAPQDITNLEKGKKITIVEGNVSGVEVLVTLEKEKESGDNLPQQRAH